MQRTIIERQKANSIEKKRVLTKAFIRMAERLNLSREELKAIIGPSDATLSRLFKASSLIDPTSKEGQLALLLLRLYRNLDTLFGGNAEQCELWLRHHNNHLNAVPIDLIKSIEGLIQTIRYLDFMRGQN